MTYEALITFTRGPAFGPIKVDAPDEESAKFAAKRYAEGCGFDDKVKKVEVRECPP